MDFRKILYIIAKAAKNRETVLIYYKRTDNNEAKWREVEPYSLSIDIAGDHLVYGKDLLSQGHIFNAYTLGKKDDHCDSFIIGKILGARLTHKKFKPRNNWKVEFL